VAHLNHQLRGPESAADEEFVRALHARLADGNQAIHLRTERLDVAGSARRLGVSIESAGRRARYDWLTTVAGQAGAGWVATGHTADDQAETVLHRLLRGAGLRGLAGIPARRLLVPGIVVVRPLLRVRRGQVLALLEALDQPWRLDSSNVDQEHTRNRLRNELLPLLASRYNPGIVDVLGRLAGQADEARNLVEDLAATVLREVELPRAGGLVILDCARMLQRPRPLIRELLRLLWRREGWPLVEMGYPEWEQAAAVALGEAPTVDLPGHVRLRRRGGVIQVGLSQ